MVVRSKAVLGMEMFGHLQILEIIYNEGFAPFREAFLLPHGNWIPRLSTMISSAETDLPEKAEAPSQVPSQQGEEPSGTI